MTGKTRKELVAELREYGFDDQADLLETLPSDAEPELTDEQQLHQNIQSIATSRRSPDEAGSLRDVVRGLVGKDRGDDR